VLPLSSSRLAGVGVGKHGVRHAPPALVEAKKVAAMTEANYISVAPHNPNGPGRTP
jgi:hypothetical protein